MYKQFGNFFQKNIPPSGDIDSDEEGIKTSDNKIPSCDVYRCISFTEYNLSFDVSRKDQCPLRVKKKEYVEEADKIMYEKHIQMQKSTT